MSSLLEVQRAMRAALLADAAAPSEVIGGAIAAAARVNVYRNNVIGNLTGALRLAFPAVVRLVGDDFFAAAAAGFIRTAPPESADLHEYGAAFPDFLAAFEPAQGLAYLPDVARLEWAVNGALHAPAAPVLTADKLRDVPEALQPRLRFVAHPSLTLLALNHPACAIWQAVLSDAAETRAARLAAIDLAAPGDTLAVLLHEGALAVLQLSPVGRDLARALIGGAALEDALADVPDTDAAPLLAGFLAHGFFARCDVSATPNPTQAG